MDNSISILSESLTKKIEVLKAIQKYNENQRAVFMSDDVNMDLFDAAIEEKDSLIEQLMKLDEGFEVLYGRVSIELNNNRQLYSEQIKEMQSKIAIIIELSVTIQAEEKRNKKLIEDYFAKQRQIIGNGRRTSKAAYGYYKSYSGSNINSSIFDEKH